MAFSSPLVALGLQVCFIHYDLIVDLELLRCKILQHSDGMLRPESWSPPGRAHLDVAEGVPMTDSEKFEGRTRERRSADEFGGGSLRDTLHLRQQLDRWIDASISDITITNADLPQEIQKRYQERLSE